jgi:aminoglycoside phosphotransferase (APT) family kinase protein
MHAPHDRMSAEQMSRWMEERTARQAEGQRPAALADDVEPAALERYLRAQLPTARDLEVHDLERIAYGAAREHYGFEASWSESGREIRGRFILLRDHEVPEELAAQYDVQLETGPLTDWVAGRGDRERELRILRFLEATPVPAPRARWLDTSGEWLGRPFTIHEHVPGRVAPSFTLLGMDSPEQRAAIARQLVDLLAAIHAVDWRTALPDLDVPEVGTHAYADRVLECLDQRLAVSLPERPAVVSRTLEWLRARRPRLESVALCHGDYKTDNLIFEGDRIRAVIDWEFAHLGDPLEDVGGVCMGLHASGELCMGLLPRDRVLEAYARASGHPVDPERVRFWEVLNTTRMLSFAHAMLGLLERGVELAAEPPDPAEVEATRAFITSMIHRMLDDLGSRAA